MADHLIGVDGDRGLSGSVRSACCESTICPCAAFHSHTDTCPACNNYTDPSTRSDGCPACNADSSPFPDSSSNVCHASTPYGHCHYPPNSDRHPNPPSDSDPYIESNPFTDHTNQRDLHLPRADVTSTGSDCCVILHAYCLEYAHSHINLHAHFDLYGNIYTNSNTFPHANKYIHLYTDLNCHALLYANRFGNLLADINFHSNLYSLIHIHTFLHSNPLADRYGYAFADSHKDTHPHLHGQAIEYTASHCHASTDEDTLLNTHDHLYTNRNIHSHVDRYGYAFADRDAYA